MTDDDWRRRWVCQWCGKHSPVPSINVEHEQRCDARPSEDA